MNVCALCLLLLVQAQSTQRNSTQRPTEGPRFEVASVREAKSRDFAGYLEWLPGRMVARNYDLPGMLVIAYDIPLAAARHLLVWNDDAMQMARFDVQAVLPNGAQSVPIHERRLLLRQLLVERFELKTHTETRQRPVYALKVLRKGALGPDIRVSEHDCDEWEVSRRAVQSVDESAPLSRAGEPKDGQGQSWCDTPRFVQGGMKARYAGKISSLIRQLQGTADRLIVDETGLNGRFEWTLTYAPPLLEPILGTGSLPVISTALKEQLGLVLEGRTAPVAVRIIDSVSIPTPN